MASAVDPMGDARYGMTSVLCSDRACSSAGWPAIAKLAASVADVKVLLCGRHLDVAAKGLLSGYVESHGWRLTAVIQAASSWPQVCHTRPHSPTVPKQNLREPDAGLEASK